MKILLFILVFFLSLVFIPDDWLYSFIMNNVSISGDGEMAMDNLDISVLLTKTGLSATLALFAVIILLPFRDRS